MNKAMLLRSRTAAFAGVRAITSRSKRPRRSARPRRHARFSLQSGVATASAGGWNAAGLLSGAPASRRASVAVSTTARPRRAFAARPRPFSRLGSR